MPHTAPCLTINRFQPVSRHQRFTRYIHCSIFWPSAASFKTDEMTLRGHRRSLVAKWFESGQRFWKSTTVTRLYTSVLHRFDNTATYWPKTARFPYTPPVLEGLVTGHLVWISNRYQVTANYNDGDIRRWKNFDDMFSRFDTIPPYQHVTDGQNWYINITRSNL